MSTEHTPGPWVITDDHYFEGSWFIETPDTSIIAKVYDKANARLIAAAPDLLKIAHEALNLATHYNLMMAAKRFQDAIAKAKGGE